MAGIVGVWQVRRMYGREGGEKAGMVMKLGKRLVEGGGKYVHR